MSKIAVFMSTYNGDRFIEKQLASLASQECKHEICVYIRDDGSSDNTIQIIEDWKKKLNIKLKKADNIGPAYSFWELLTDKKISADFYAFCDQDDIWDNDKLQVAVEHLGGDVHLYACNCRSINAKDEVIEEFRKKESPDIILEKLFVSGFTQGCAMVFTDALRNSISKMHISCIPMHDMIVCMYALMYGEIFWDQTPHFSYRFHDTNVVANKKRKGVFSKIATIKRWKKNKENSLTTVATELLKNNVIDDVGQKEFLINMSNAKKSLKSKLYLVKCRKIKNKDRNALYSFYLRILFGWI